MFGQVTGMRTDQTQEQAPTWDPKKEIILYLFGYSLFLVALV